MSTVQIIQDGQALTVDASDPRARPPVSPSLPQPFTLYKTDIESRMTDDELAAFDAALTAATVRARRLWTDCQMVHSDDPFFATLTSQLTTAFGTDRAAAILARTGA